MKMTREGLDLIKQYEGFRALAYRDVVGVWTIGYGHTSMAGAPMVESGMRVSKATAREILARDVAKFAAAIRPLITQPINDQQFSALVSFAYNVGVGNFRRSSVLRCVNNGDFDAVPRRLSLWVKAGGRTLRGLVRRRAAEAMLFATDAKTGTSKMKRPPMRHPVEVQTGKPALRSTTNFAAIFAAIAGLIGSCRDSLEQLSALFSHAGLTPILLLIILCSLGWIIRERYLKSRDEGI